MSAQTPASWWKTGLYDSSACVHGQALGDIEHDILKCSSFDADRKTFLDELMRKAAPHSKASDILFPPGHWIFSRKLLRFLYHGSSVVQIWEVKGEPHWSSWFAKRATYLAPYQLVFVVLGC